MSFPIMPFMKKINIPRNGLVAEYLANNNFLDTSGNGYNGVNNNVTFGPDRNSNPNSAFVFNGTTAFVDIDAALAGLSTNTTGTISLWVKTTTETTTAISFGDTDANVFFAIFLGEVTGSLTDELITIVAVNGGTANRIGYTTSNRNELFDDTWHHIVAISTGSLYKIYLDNSEKSLTVGTGSNNGKWIGDLPGIDNGRIACINRNNLGDASFLPGLVDDIRTYDRALTTPEINTLFNE